MLLFYYPQYLAVVIGSQVPAYIITLHELLALTPHDHVERNALEYAQSILEDLSTVGKPNLFNSSYKSRGLLPGAT
jgi:hypothetical protein